MECNSPQPFKSVYLLAMACAIAKPELTEKIDIIVERASGTLSNDSAGNLGLILNELPLIAVTHGARPR